MGHGMAKNIVEKGYSLVVMGRRNRKPVEDLVGARRDGGEDPARSRRARRRIVFLCVTGSPEVEAVVSRPRRAARRG